MKIQYLLNHFYLWINEPFNNIIEWVMNNPGPIVALIGISVSYKVLKKKLIEDHITSAIQRMQIANHNVYKESERLIDGYILNIDKEDSAGIEQFWKQYDEIKELSYISLDGNSELATLTYFLKITLQTYGKEYRSDNIGVHELKNINHFIIKILEKVSEYSTKLVPVPRTVKSSNVQLLKKSYRSFITNKSIYTFRDFNAGIIRDKKSSYQLILFSHINGSSSILLKYSAQKAFRNTHPLTVFLFNKNLYAPSVLEFNGSPIWSKIDFILIGFDEKTYYNGDSISYTIILYYSNLENIGVIHNLNNTNFTKKLIDKLTGNPLAILSLKEFKIERNLSETLSFEIDRDEAERLFKQNKTIVRKKLKGGN